MQWKKLVLLSLLSINTAYADSDGMLGLWETIDDHTGEPLSEVKIWREGNTLMGKVVKLMKPEKYPVCGKCKGDKKNQKIVGLTILSGFELEDDEWSSGYILDPNNGKTYRASLGLMDNGAKLKVRGYIGIPALGRTQYWTKKTE